MASERPWTAILVGGFIAGAIDIAFASIEYQVGPDVILRFIASGIVGPAASRAGGIGIAALGAICHFFISFAAAAVYVLASRVMPILVRQAILGGLTFGAAMFFIMNWVVVPLSNARSGHFTPLSLAINLIDHMVLFGVPIALCAKYFTAQKRVFS
jgi:uncharacterized membrane protein YagU involved in acid resistance